MLIKPELVDKEVPRPLYFLDAALEEYDSIYRRHLQMQSEFRNTQKWKALLAEVLDARSQLASKQTVLIQMWRAGANEDQLQRCRAAARDDFVGAQLPRNCLYTWHQVFEVKPTWPDSTTEPLPIPIELPPCQVAAIWDCVLSSERPRLVRLGSLELSTTQLCPLLILSDAGLEKEEYGSAVAGLVASASNMITSVDIRGNMFSGRHLLDISRSICTSVSIASLNGLSVRNSMGDDLSLVVSRSKLAEHVAPLNSMVPENIMALSFSKSSPKPKLKLDLGVEEWDFVLSRVMRQHTHPSEWKELRLRYFVLGCLGWSKFVQGH